VTSSWFFLSTLNHRLFKLVPCINKVLYLSQLMLTNYFVTVKSLKQFKTVIFVPKCFDLHKPSSGSYSLRFAKVTILIATQKSLFKCSELWLHTSFSPVASGGPGSSVGIATDYGLGSPDRIPVATRFSARPDRPWGAPSLL